MSFNCKNHMWTEISNSCRFRSHNYYNATSLKVQAGKKQACSQALRFGWQNLLLWGQGFCFYYGICLKQTFLGTQKFRDTATE